MKYSFILSLAVFLACNNNDGLNQNLPDCIREIVSDSITSERIIAIQSQIVNDEQVYWLNTDIIPFDSAGYVLSTSCDTLCTICGECVGSACEEYYSEDDWVIIWEK